MLSRVGLIMGLLVVTKFSISECGMPGGKCSTMEYFMSLGSSFAEYARGMSLAATRTPVGTELLNYHKLTCSNDLLTKSMKCVTEVDAMCQYTLVSPEVMTGVKDIICNKIDDLLQAGSCSPDVGKFVASAKTVNIDTTNPICSTTAAIKRCLGELLSPCSSTLKTIVNNLVDQLDSGQCTNAVQESGPCTMASSLFSVVACYSKFGTTIVDVLKACGNSSSTCMTNICGMSSFNEALTCHREVEERCEKSLVDGGKLRIVKDTMCSNVADLVQISGCVQLDYKAILGCVAGKAQATSDVCTLMHTGIRACFSDLFSSCSAGIKQTMDEAFNILIPSTCDNSNSKTKCSVMSYMGSMGACWASSIMGVVSKFMPQLNLPGASCSGAVITQGRDCHAKLDSVCGSSMMRAESVRDILVNICENPQVFSKFATCFRGDSVSYITQCSGIDLNTNSVDNKDDVCRLIHNARECSLKPFSHSGCDASVTNFMRTVVDSVIPTQCPIKDERPQSSGHVIRPTVFVAVIALFAIVV